MIMSFYYESFWHLFEVRLKRKVYCIELNIYVAIRNKYDIKYSVSVTDASYRIE